jgi:hypothetical protein
MYKNMLRFVISGSVLSVKPIIGKVYGNVSSDVYPHSPFADPNVRRSVANRPDETVRQTVTVVSGSSTATVC